MKYQIFILVFCSLFIANVAYAFDQDNMHKQNEPTLSANNIADDERPTVSVKGDSIPSEIPPEFAKEIDKNKQLSDNDNHSLENEIYNKRKINDGGIGESASAITKHDSPNTHSSSRLKKPISEALQPQKTPEVSASMPSWQKYILIWLIITIIGTILGCTDTIVVFRNYDDLAMVFFIVFSIAAATYLLVFFSNANTLLFGSALFLTFTIFAALLFLAIFFRTWQDNKSLIKVFFAFITKITLAIFFLFQLLGLVSPSGKTQRERAKNRASSLVYLMFITPLIYRLVREHTGVFTPKHILNKYQRHKLKL